MSYQGIIHDLDEAIYHSHPALSSTQARTLLDSPARYKHALANPQPHKDAFDLGTAVHSKVLGVGAKVITYPDEHLTPSGSVSTKAATVEWVEGQRKNGTVVVTRKQQSLADGMAEAVLAHPVARALFEKPGRPEASMFATDPETGVGVRARFDFLPDMDAPNPIAVDLKTTGKAADSYGFMRSVSDFGYDVQQEHYEDTLGFAGFDAIPFVFVVVETYAPHLVGLHQLDVVWREMGRQKSRKARELLAECTASDTWPGYPEEVNLLSPPVWAVYQNEEKYG